MIRTLFNLLPTAGTYRYLLLSVLSALLRAAGAVLLVPLVSALFTANPAASPVWPWVGWLALVTLLGWLVDWWLAKLGFTLGFGLLDSTQKAVADHLTRLPLTWFTGQNRAAARQAIAATGPEMAGLVTYQAGPILSAILLPLMLGLALLAVSVPLGLVALAGIPLLLGAYWAALCLSRAAERAAHDANITLTERLVEFARTQQALRAARRVSPERSQVGDALNTQHAATLRLILMQIPGQLVFSLASQLVLLALAGMTVWLTANHHLNVPQAIALIAVTIRYLEPFTILGGLSGGIETVSATLGNIATVMQTPALAEGTRTLPPPSRLQARAVIELRGVSFRYAPDLPPVLDNLNLTLQPGTTTAIVGPSGSGKSTVLNLLAGLVQPTQGRLLVAGEEVSTLSQSARRELVSMVFQQPYLFDGSLRENVLAGSPGATPEQLAQVAALARLEALLGASPAGWDSPVGEGGGRLSGGERQRVSIARALLKPAPLLLIDEATSALDTENEAAITTALDKQVVTGNAVPRTRVIVAHRLASLRGADRILFLEDGKIVEDGSPADLLAAGGRFADFWKQRNAVGGWKLGADNSV